MGTEEIAKAIILIANSMMSKILRIVSVERGYDPRGYTLVAFGGAGPMHVCALAEELEVERIIVPSNPGMFSALGLLTADMFHDYIHPVVKRVSLVDPTEIEAKFRIMGKEGRNTLASEGVKVRSMSFIRQFDLRYFGQAYELTVKAPSRVNAESLATTIIDFHRRHTESYGYSAEGEQVEIVNLRLRAVGAIPKPDLKETICRGEPKRVGTRRIYFEAEDLWTETPIYERGVSWNSEFTGPAVIEQYDATTVVYPGWSVGTDEFGNMILEREEQ